MKYTPSIEPANYESILFTDLYKLTMCWAVLKCFPNVKVKYTFNDRNNTVYPKGFDVELRRVIDGFRNRTLSKQRKKEFAEKCPFLPMAFIDFLEVYRFDPSEVGVIQDDEGHLILTISGYWYRTILWEVPLMAAICDLFYKMTNQVIDVDADTITEIHRKKASQFRMNSIPFAEFGTRRAYSPRNHENVVKTFVDYAEDTLLGTSNVELACAYGIKAIGTFAHEWVSAHAAMFGYSHPNRHAMQSWVSVYNGNLGIALPDTFTTDAFLVDFDSMFANLFTGTRHDSGDPLVYMDKMIAHYKKLGIDPTTKTITYSDGMNWEEVEKVMAYRVGEIRRGPAIGTWFTNDLPDIKPMNIVIKLTECDGLPAVKISDNPIKAIGDKKTIEFAMWQVGQQIDAYTKK